ncbi:MAG: HdeD family acid-resistance protein [Longimicrobiales bacterium]
MHAQWTQGWWVWAVRGIVAVFFGVIALMYPAPSLLLALLLFGAYLQLDGLAAVALAISLGLHDRAVWPLAAVGLMGLLGGMLIMLWPDMSATILVLTLGICCLVRGGLEIFHAIRFRNWLRRSALLALAGFVAMGFGTLLLIQPAIATGTLVFAFAGCVIVAGLCQIASALRMRAVQADVLTSDGGNAW